MREAPPTDMLLDLNNDNKNNLDKAGSVPSPPGFKGFPQAPLLPQSDFQPFNYNYPVSEYLFLEHSYSKMLFLSINLILAKCFYVIGPTSASAFKCWRICCSKRKGRWYRLWCTFFIQYSSKR